MLSLLLKLRQLIQQADMTNAISIVIIAVLAVLAFVLGSLGCKILNKIPAKWLCDYDEEPSEELLSGNRFKKSWGLLMGAVFAVFIAMTIITNGVGVKLPAIFILYFFLMLISASDAKYTIIPDEFTVVVLVISIGLAVIDLVTVKSFVKAWYEPLIGGACGGTVLLALDMLSTLMFKKPGFGFGDVKLLAAMGIMLGWKCTLVVLVTASFLAVVHILVLIFSGKTENGIYLPMGPYLCCAAGIVVILQPYFEKMLGMYMNLLTMTALP